MRKISCPKCKSAWDKDQYIKFHMQPNTDLVITRVKIQDMVFCPYCFFRPRNPNIDGMEKYDAKTDKVLLQEDNIKIRSIVVEDEFGRYIDMDINDFKKLKISGFDSYFDEEDGSSEATETWGGAGPDYCTVPEGVRL